jgi:SAM-dependent methyltransferase
MDRPRLILNYPWRSPSIVPATIQNIIKDKVVCDVGCAYGDLLVELSKFCKRAIGVENDKERLCVARQRGFEVEEVSIPLADVYYVWIGEASLPWVLETLKDRSGLLILAEGDIQKHLGGYELEIIIDEKFDEIAKLEGHESRDTFRIQIVSLPYGYHKG